MKISLVNNIAIKHTSTQFNIPQPLGLLCIAASCPKDYAISLISPITTFKNLLSHSESFYRQTAKRILKSKPDIVGMTTRCDCYFHTIEMARHIRKLDAHVPILFGGPVASICDVDTLTAFPFVTAIVRGEGEMVFSTLVEALKKKSSLKNIPNVTYRLHGKICRTADAPPIRDLNELSPLDFSLLPKQSLQNKVTHIEVGRGCPYNCTFCSSSSFFSRFYRLKSPERILSEMKEIHRLYPTKKTFTFTHDNLTALKTLCTELCQSLIKDKSHFTWRCSSRIDNVTPDLLKLMKKAGCKSIFFGIETGSQRMQKLINKHLQLTTIPPILDICRQLKIDATASFIVGFPEETEQDVEDTLQLIIACHTHGRHNTQLHLLTPLLGSALYKQHKDDLYYSTNHVSDFTFIPNKQEERMVKKYPNIFSMNYRFKIPQFTDYQLAAFTTFGRVSDMMPKTLAILFSKQYIESYVALCNHVATAFKSKKIFDHQKYLSVNQDNYRANLFVRETEAYIRTHVPHALALLDKMNNELLAFGIKNADED